MGLHRQREALLGTDVQARSDRVLDILQRLVSGLPLTDAAWNSWAFRDPDAILVTVDGDSEFHGVPPSTARSSHDSSGCG